jgi:hypothetical protein
MTDYLFARPSFLEGMGRNFDLFGTLQQYNYAKTGAEADQMALSADWAAVYGDFWNAYDDLLCQIEAKKTVV